MLDDIAEANFLPGDETWEANSIRLALTPFFASLFLLHHFK
jgi:hypothetical protein